MTFWQFLDAHWGFWFAVFLLAIAGIFGQVATTLLAVIAAIFIRKP